MATFIERDEVRRRIENGAQLVEVLPPKEFSQQHLAGAINIPLTKLGRDTTARLHRDQAIIVYCYDLQ